MSTKKNLTIEELEKACEEAKANFNELHDQLKHMKKEEADRKEAELALQKEKRMEEIDAAIEHLKKLYKAYIEDYGYLKIETKTDDYDWFPSFQKYGFWF